VTLIKFGENPFKNWFGNQSGQGSVVLPFYMDRQDLQSPRPCHRYTLVTLDP
jgi:hypothetical protein